ncbi:MAG: TRAP transporter small permease [Gemmatimonadota bacterium]
MARTGESTVEKALGWFLVVLMGVSVVNVLWQVFTRFALARPSSYTEELARYLLIWIGLVGAGYASAKRLHLAIDLLPRRVSGGRWGRTLAVIIELCVITFAGVVLVGGGLGLVRITLSLGQTSAALGIPMGWVYSALPVSGALIVWFSSLRVRDLLRRTEGR